MQTLDLLRNHPDVITAPSLAGRVGAIALLLVDEFQDTDRTQTEIVERLAGDDFQGGGMFVVGDVRQSIYRFRGAEPDIFDGWRQRLPVAGRKDLKENFRSVPGVIDFVNALFAEYFAACGTGSGPDAEHPEEHRLVAVRPDPNDGRAGPAVHFLWALPGDEGQGGSEGAGDGDGDGPRKPVARDRRENEARLLAHWLKTRLEAGWTITDRQTNQPRRRMAATSHSCSGR